MDVDDAVLVGDLAPAILDLPCNGLLHTTHPLIVQNAQLHQLQSGIFEWQLSQRGREADPWTVSNVLLRILYALFDQFDCSLS